MEFSSPFQTEVLPRFVVFEGIDGSGKSTQISLLQRYLADCGQHCWQTREPTDNPIGRYIRQQLSLCLSSSEAPHSIPSSLRLSPLRWAALFALDRAEHLYRSGGATQPGGIVDLCQRGWWCLCDRYLFSSLAYQGEEIFAQRVKQFNQHFPLPQWIFFLHLPPHLIEARLATRSQHDIYEKTSILLEVQQRYQRILAQIPAGAVQQLTLDASQPVDQIQQQLRAALAAPRA